MARKSNIINWMRFPLPVVLKSLMKALKSFFHFRSWLVRKGALVCEFSGVYLLCQREFHVSVKYFVIDRSVNVILFGDLFRHMKPLPAQHAVRVFPAKRPLETKLCMLIFRKRVASQTPNFACRFLYTCFANLRVISVIQKCHLSLQEYLKCARMCVERFGWFRPHSKNYSLHR